MLQRKKKKNKITEEKGDSRCHRLLHEAALSEERKEGDGNVVALACFVAQRSSTTERRRRRQLAFFVELNYCTAPQQREEGDGTCRHLLHGAALQHSSRGGRRRRWQLPSPFSWTYAITLLLSPALLCWSTAQLHSREKKATVAVVAFFVELRCSAAPQQGEEGNGSCRRLLCGAALQRSFIAKRRR
jgi:hypothetical protein